MPDLKLPAVLEAADPETMAAVLDPFLGNGDAAPKVETTRLQPPICYWAVYEHGHRRATFKAFFHESDFLDYREKLERYYPERIDRPDHDAGGIAFLPELNAVVWGFPFDPVMPELWRCMEPEWVADVMRKPGLALECKLIDYNPEIGAIVAYRRAADRAVVAFGKVSTEETCGLIYLVMDRLWNSAARRENRLLMPKPLAYRPRVGFLLQARVYGRPIEPDRNSRTFMELVKAAGSTLSTLHDVDVPFGPERPLAFLIDRLANGLDDLKLTAPPLYITMRGLVDQLRERDAAGRPSGVVGCHGDFKYDQLLKHRRRFILIDYELFCQAEPWLDLGTFCAYLVPTSPRDWRDSAATELLRAEFLRGYLRSGRWIDWPRLGLYEAAMLATRALSLVWGQMGGWQMRASGLLDLALERLVAPEPPPEPARRQRKRRPLAPA